jgi:DNA-binding NarL/FixJ family response regulator
MAKLRILLADDHRLMLAALRRVLEHEPDLEVVAEIDGGSRVVPAVGSLRPDIVLLDIRMPELDGLTCLARLRSLYPATRVVVFSTYADDARIEEARAGGARGYIVKTADPMRLPELLRAAAADEEGFFVVDGTPEIPEPPGGPALSSREQTVLEALARGLSNKEIAAELWVTEQTVKFHLRNLYRKIGVASRAEAARYAIGHGLLGARPDATDILAGR